MKKLKTIEDCYKATGRDPKAMQEVFKLLEAVMPKAVADCKLAIAIEAINKSVPPDWEDFDELKYFPRFFVEKDPSKPSGFGLSADVYGLSSALTTVGSRLTFRSLEGLKYGVKQFLDLYEASYL